MKKNCLSCPNLYYDQERAHYKCKYTKKVVYDEREEKECWGIYVKEEKK